jgi:hypothetical protein
MCSITIFCILSTAPEAPTNLAAEAMVFDTVVLNWDPPRQSFGIIIHYIITYQLMGGEEVSAVKEMMRVKRGEEIAQ